MTTDSGIFPPADGSSALGSMVTAIFGNGGATQAAADKMSSLADFMTSSTKMVDAITGRSGASDSADSQRNAAGRATTDSDQAAALAAKGAVQATVAQQNLQMQKNAFVQGEATKIFTSSPDADGNSRSLVDMTHSLANVAADVSARSDRILANKQVNMADDPVGWLRAQIELPFQEKHQAKAIQDGLGLHSLIAGLQDSGDKTIQTDVNTNQAFNDASAQIDAANKLSANMQNLAAARARTAGLGYEGASSLLSADQFTFDKMVKTQQLKNEQVSLGYQGEAAERARTEAPYQIDYLKAHTGYMSQMVRELSEKSDSNEMLSQFLAKSPGDYGFTQAPDAQMLNRFPQKQKDYLATAALSQGGYPGVTPADRILRLTDADLPIRGGVAETVNTFNQRVLAPAAAKFPDIDKLDMETRATLLQQGNGKAILLPNGKQIPAFDGLDKIIQEDRLNRDTHDNLYSLGSLGNLNNPNIASKFQGNPLLPIMQEAGKTSENRPFSGMDTLNFAYDLHKKGLPIEAAASHAANLVSGLDEINNATKPFMKLGIPPSSDYRIMAKLGVRYGETPSGVNMRDPISIANYIARREMAEKQLSHSTINPGIPGRNIPLIVPVPAPTGGGQ